MELAQRLQTAAIVLSDQFIGQSTAVITEPERRSSPAQAAPCEDRGNDYLRYRLTESGVSTMAAPGEGDRRYTADGLEHNEQGTPSARDDDHQRQLAKRQRKLSEHDYGSDWARREGEGTLGLLCFGSASAAVAEAADLLAEQGVDCRTVALRLIAPLQESALESALAGCERVFVVEQNHGAQLYHYLRGQMDFAMPLHSYARPGPVPLSGAAIVAAIAEVNPL